MTRADEPITHLPDGGRWGAVPLWLLDSDVSPQAIRLFALIAAKHVDQEHASAFPSRRRLASDPRVASIRTVNGDQQRLDVGSGGEEHHGNECAGRPRSRGRASPRLPPRRRWGARKQPLLPPLRAARASARMRQCSAILQRDGMCGFRGELGGRYGLPALRRGVKAFGDYEGRGRGALQELPLLFRTRSVTRFLRHRTVRVALRREDHPVLVCSMPGRGATASAGRALPPLRGQREFCTSLRSWRE